MSTKTRVVSLMIIVVSLISTMPLKAWAEDGPIMKREDHQQDRISQGIKSGSLTPGEAAHLEKGEQRLEQNREKALADGKLSPKEKARLEREANRESRQIHNAKHNRRRAS